MDDRSRRWDAVADVIDARMADLGLDQVEVARRAGVSDLTVRELQKNLKARDRQKGTLTKISVALELAPNFLYRISTGEIEIPDDEALSRHTKPASSDDEILDAHLASVLRALSIDGRSQVLLYAQHVLDDESDQLRGITDSLTRRRVRELIDEPLLGSHSHATHLRPVADVDVIPNLDVISAETNRMLARMVRSIKEIEDDAAAIAELERQFDRDGAITPAVQFEMTLAAKTAMERRAVRLASEGGLAPIPEAEVRAALEDLERRRDDDQYLADLRDAMGTGSTHRELPAAAKDANSDTQRPGTARPRPAEVEPEPEGP